MRKNVKTNLKHWAIKEPRNENIFISGIISSSYKTAMQNAQVYFDSVISHGNGRWILQTGFDVVKGRVIVDQV